jgi:hypothetical protein
VYDQDGRAMKHLTSLCILSPSVWRPRTPYRRQMPLASYCARKHRRIGLPS